MCFSPFSPFSSPFPSSSRFYLSCILFHFYFPPWIRSEEPSPRLGFIVRKQESKSNTPLGKGVREWWCFLTLDVPTRREAWERPRKPEEIGDFRTSEGGRGKEKEKEECQSFEPTNFFPPVAFYLPPPLASFSSPHSPPPPPRLCHLLTFIFRLSARSP